MKIVETMDAILKQKRASLKYRQNIILGPKKNAKYRKYSNSMYKYSFKISTHTIIHIMYRMKSAWIIFKNAAKM